MPLHYLWVSLPMRFYMFKRYNVSVHRAAANKLNIENRATRGSVCNALLSGDLWSIKRVEVAPRTS